MSVDHLKKQAKNAQRLLEAFRAQPKGPVKLSQAQEFVAQMEGYPNWHSALQAKQAAEAGSQHNKQSAQDAWLLRYEEHALSDDEEVSHEIRIINGAADALAMLWHSFAEFDGRQDVPGTPDRLILSLIDNDEPGCIGDQSLELTYTAHFRRIRITLSALDSRVVMLDGPYSEATLEIDAALAKRDRPEDVAALFAAAKVPFDLIQAELAEYHRNHPTKGAVLSIDEHLRAALAQKAKTQGPRDGIWDCETWRLGRWRIRLQYLTAADDFYFDAFDEAGGTGSVVLPTNVASIKRKVSGQWIAGDFQGMDQPTVLADVPDAAMNDLRAIARDWGIGFVVDGQTEFAPAEQGEAPGHKKFLQWLREKHPEALEGGKYG